MVQPVNGVFESSSVRIHANAPYVQKGTVANEIEVIPNVWTTLGVG